MKYLRELILFIVFWNVGLFSYKACAFPIWAICKVDATPEEASKIKVLPAPNEVDLGIKDWELEKTVLVQVWGVDNECVWVYTGPEVLKENVKPPLHCIKETKCNPIFKVNQ